ncbi:2-amino-4-hydroxy-6-hydroxymethyldihydropteridine diphosphokinase [Salinarimonas ramus]|uniref:Bifunctional folate synthesis protein n=1 Tax=Salinarimonas ramus TaxID=690164 RepID=A0A917QEX2_9HYPH|nr:2-amino-4-hydroxy-6-hydroxymethyldihydropteridine diphosphokinase [Salinarimonas ramus]GGK45529.1 7,8-dihydroneopterin aldolase [Salinarimonas ramus]
MSDRVFVSNLILFAHHGVHAEETRLGQRFSIDIECGTDFEEAARGDDPEAVVDYGALCALAAEVSASGPFKLVETLAERIASGVLGRFPAVLDVRVRVRKPSAPVPAVLDHVGVEIHRVRRTPIALSLGSNVGDSRATLRAALAKLGAAEGVAVEAVSHVYRTAPWGRADQQDFLNLCATGWTSLPPRALLRLAKAIELQLGRTPEVRWGPRVIDIDLLHYGDLALRGPELTLPHPEMGSRAFVLVPLAEIAPDRVIGGVRVADALARLAREPGDVVRLDDPG